MYREQTLTQDRVVSNYPFTVPLTYASHIEGLDRKEILRVLERAVQDNSFIAQLTSRGSKALQGYNLSSEAQAALASGDIGWIEARVGKLDARLNTWTQCRLEQESW